MNKRPFTADDLLQMRFVGSPMLSPNGEELLFVETHINDEDNGYRAAIRRVSGAQSPVAFTKFAAKVRDAAPCWSPDGQQIAYLSNRGGSNQVWLAGQQDALTDLPKGVTRFIWAPDSKGMYLIAKEVVEQPKFRKGATARRINRLRYKANGTGYLDGNPAQLWYFELASKSLQQLTNGLYDCSQPAVSPCGRYLAFVANREDNELKTLNDIWLLNIDSKELRNLTQGKGNSSCPSWLPDGEHLIYVGHQKGVYPGGYPELRQINIVSGDNVNLLPDFAHYIGNSIGGDVRFDSGNSAPLVSADGKQVHFLSTIGGSCYLYSLDCVSGEVTKVFGEGQMVVTSFDMCAGKLLLNAATPSSPGDLWWGSTAGELKQITALNQKLFIDAYIGTPETIHFTHPDGTQLEGWLIKPLGFRDGETYPLVMEIHGGPHTTYGNVFFHEWQMLAGHGMGVLYTNPRGSLGYGEAFSRAVVGDWCGVDARDLQFMAEETAKLPWVDKARIGVTGGSQGGYFTNWLIGHTDMFAAAVTQRSMSNLYSKYGVADNGWNGDRYGMGGRDLWEDEDFIMERSPMRYARNVKTPTLIIHSDEDYRCPLEQAEQWYVALRRLGVKVEMLLFHGENHELSRGGRPANRIVRLEAILDWFQRHL